MAHITSKQSFAAILAFHAAEYKGMASYMIPDLPDTQKAVNYQYEDKRVGEYFFKSLFPVHINDEERDHEPQIITYRPDISGHGQHKGRNDHKADFFML